MSNYAITISRLKENWQNWLREERFTNELLKSVDALLTSYYRISHIN